MRNTWARRLKIGGIALATIAGSIYGAHEGSRLFHNMTAFQRNQVSLAQKRLGEAMTANEAYALTLNEFNQWLLKHGLADEKNGIISLHRNAHEKLRFIPVAEKRRILNFKPRLSELENSDLGIANAKKNYSNAFGAHSRLVENGSSKFRAAGALVGPAGVLLDLVVLSLLFNQGRKWMKRRGARNAGIISSST